MLRVGVIPPEGRGEAQPGVISPLPPAPNTKPPLRPSIVSE